MRFLEVTTCPGKYMYWHYRLHPDLGRAPYVRQKAEFLADGVGAGLRMARGMGLLGYESEVIVANNLNLQRVWAEENRLAMPVDYVDLVLKQIERYEPDILYITDCAVFDGRFLSRLGKAPRLIIGWHGAPWPAGVDLTGYDLMLSPLRVVREQAVACGAGAAEYAFAGFDAGQVLPAQAVERRLDVAFSGTWGPDYSRRKAWLEVLAEGGGALGGVSRIFCLHRPGQEELPAGVAGLDRGAVWGRRMYGLLAGARMVVNALADFAQGEAPNARHMEATGMGALLLAEEHPSLRAFFSDAEVPGFASAAELLEKIDYYCGHEAERQAVAGRGQARCLRDFNTDVRARAMDRRIERALRQASFSRAEREALLREAGQMLAAGEQGLVQAAGGLDKDITAALWEAFCQGDAPAVAALGAVREKLTADGFEHAFCACLNRAMQGDLPTALGLLRQELEIFPENDRARGIYAQLLAAYPA